MLVYIKFQCNSILYFQLAVIYNSNNKSFHTIYVHNGHIHREYKLAPNWCSSITAYKKIGNKYVK